MITRNSIGFGALALAAIAFAAPVLAQQTQRPAQPAQRPAAAPATPQGVKVPLKASPEQQDWVKVCGEDPSIQKTICYTTRDFVAENNQPVMAVAVYAVKDEARRFVRILVPLTFMIPPGIRMSVEGLAPVAARFQICLPQGCFVEGDLNDAAINQIKKAGTLRIDMQNQVGQEVNFELPLGNFGKVYDSAGVDQATLQKMAEEAARQQQQGANPANADALRRQGEELARQRQGGAPAPAAPKP